RAVIRHIERYRRWKLSAVEWKLGADLIDDFDRIGVGLAEDRQDDRPAVIAPARRLLVLHPLSDRRYFAETHRLAVPPRNHQGPIVIGSHELRGRVEGEIAALAIEAADRRVGIGGGDRTAEIGK